MAIDQADYWQQPRPAPAGLVTVSDPWSGAIGEVMSPWWDTAVQFLRWMIRASLLSHATTFEADIVGAQIFRQKSENLRVTLTAGFRDGSGVVELGQLTDGVIDEYSITRTRASLVAHIVGRDAMAELIDREYSKRYVRFPGPKVASGESTVPTVVGIFRASQVAAEICAAAGMTLAWETRDYELWEDFDGVGRCIDLLERLIAPWNVADPNRTDIFCEGKTVYIRKRNPFPATADYTYSMTDGRIQSVTLLSHKLPEIRSLELTGRVQVPRPVEASTSGPEIGVSGTFVSYDAVEFLKPTPEQESSVWMRPVEGTQVAQYSTRTYNELGDAQFIEERVITRTPGNQILESVKNTYQPSPESSAIELVSSEKTTFEWDESLYDDKGPINQPLPRRSRKAVRVREGVDLGDALVFAWVDVQTEDTTYGYDDQNYQTTKSILTQSRVVGGTLERPFLQGTLQDVKLEVETLRDAGPGLVWRRMEIFEAAPIPGTESLKYWKLAHATESIAGGHRPGGPNRPSLPGPASPRPIRKSLPGPLVPNDPPPGPKAVKAEAGGRDMSAADLAHIQNLHAEASGLWETEITFEALAIPWLKKGSIVKFTEITDERGQEIPLGNALIYQLTSTFDKENKRATMTGRAVFWSTEGAIP